MLYLELGQRETEGALAIDGKMATGSCTVKRATSRRKYSSSSGTDGVGKMATFISVLLLIALSCPALPATSNPRTTTPFFAHGLVNVPSFAEAARGRRRHGALFSAPEATAEKEAEAASSPKLKGVWVPPSQNVEQRRGNVFSIHQPEDLLNFVIEDERLSVVKVYATWCKTCKVFDMRYRKVASQFGDRYDDSKTGKSAHTAKRGRARFAEMKYDGKNEEILSAILGTHSIPLPYILMYKGSKGSVKGFQCTPNKVQMLTDAVNELADPVVKESFGEHGNSIGEANGVDGPDPLSKPSDAAATTQKSVGATNTYLSKLSS